MQLSTEHAGVPDPDAVARPREQTRALPHKLGLGAGCPATGGLGAGCFGAGCTEGCSAGAAGCGAGGGNAGSGATGDCTGGGCTDCIGCIGGSVGGGGITQRPASHTRSPLHCVS